MKSLFTGLVFAEVAQPGTARAWKARGSLSLRSSNLLLGVTIIEKEVAVFDAKLQPSFLFFPFLNKLYLFLSIQLHWMKHSATFQMLVI